MKEDLHLRGVTRVFPPVSDGLSEAVQSRWPGLTVAPALAAGCEGPYAADHYLARACAAGMPAALAIFERECLAPLACTDDVRQVVRCKLLVERRIEGFAGRSTLLRWVKTVAARCAVDLARGKKEEPLEARMLELFAPSGGSPELGQLQAQARQALADALQAALSKLSERDRLFLQHRYLDGLSLTAISALYDVVPSTVMRALERAQQELSRAARLQLRDRLQLSEEAVESLIRGAGSQLSP